MIKLHKVLSAACLSIAMACAVTPGTAAAQDSNVLNVATDATFPPMESSKTASVPASISTS